MFNNAEEVLKRCKRGRPLTALEITLKVEGKNKPNIYKELTKLVKYRQAKKIKVKIGEITIVFYKTLT